MIDHRLGEVETKFAKIIWREAPLPSSELVKICRTELNWNKSTTYTVLRKLCNRGIFKNENTIVSVVMTEDEFNSAAGEEFVDELFKGSLPAFIAAFTSRKELSVSDVAEIKRMIAEYEEKAK
ncbi:MAG: BlaI/MecI/CopY family transcriptional regulator [Clostridia bacterium]|nr:BlaI/MecI/CopY family transcriptional regulator [Clostridia bacterium]